MAFKGYHAHVYFDPQQQEFAVGLRHEIDRQFAVELGRVHESPIGPHLKGMYQVKFNQGLFADFVPWLMLHRGDLDILVHADTGEDLADHTQHALWLGRSLDLNLSVFDT